MRKDNKNRTNYNDKNSYFVLSRTFYAAARQNNAFCGEVCQASPAQLAPAGSAHGSVSTKACAQPKVLFHMFYASRHNLYHVLNLHADAADALTPHAKISSHHTLDPRIRTP